MPVLPFIGGRRGGAGGGGIFVDVLPALADAREDVTYIRTSDWTEWVIDPMGAPGMPAVPAVPAVNPRVADFVSEEFTAANDPNYIGAIVFGTFTGANNYDVGNYFIYPTSPQLWFIVLDSNGLKILNSSVDVAIIDGVIDPAYRMIIDHRDSAVPGDRSVVFANETAAIAEFVRQGIVFSGMAPAFIYFDVAIGTMRRILAYEPAMPGVPEIPAIPATPGSRAWQSLGISGRTLGPEQNIFGVDATADKAAARVVLDAYAADAANAAWLAAYNGDVSLLVLLKWAGNGIAALRRNAAGNDWEDVTDLIIGPAGQAGQDANAAVSEAARDAAQAAQAAAEAAQLAAEVARDASAASQALSNDRAVDAETARNAAILARDAALAAQVAAEVARNQAQNARDAALAAAGDAAASAHAAADTDAVLAAVLAAIMGGVGIDIDRSVDGQITITATGGGALPVGDHIRYLLLTETAAVPNAAAFLASVYRFDSDRIVVPAHDEARYYHVAEIYNDIAHITQEGTQEDARRRWTAMDDLVERELAGSTHYVYSTLAAQFAVPQAIPVIFGR